MGRERISRATVEQHQRERILDAAVGVFAKRGFQRTTIDNLVVASKSSVGSFYGLFEGKQECFLRCYDRVVALRRARIEALLPDDGSWEERAARVISGLLSMVEEDPMAAKIVFVEAQTAGIDGLRRYEATLDELIPLLRGGRALTARGEALPVNLEEASLAGSAWLIHEKLVTGGAKGIQKLGPELAAITLGPYLGEKEARRLLTSSAATA